MAWMNRLWNLIRRGELDKGLDDELQFHLDARMQDNLTAGMSPAEAREDARRRFGNLTSAKERVREADLFAWIETLGRDLRYSIRSLRKTPAFTAVAILVIALGVGANTAMFTVVNGVLLRPLPFPHPDRLFFISYTPKDWSAALGPLMADHNYLEFRNLDTQFESVTSYNPNGVTLTHAGDPVRLNGVAVTPDFLRVLRVNPAAGRGFLREEGETGRNSVVVLSDKLWRSRFATDPAMVGQTIVLDGVPHTVIGIMPPGFEFPANTDLWTPMEIRLQSGNSFSRPVLGRLKDGVSPAQAQDAFTSLAASLPADPRAKPTQMEARLLPIKDVVVGEIRKSLLVFSGAVAFVLLIACANVANLLLMRAASRRREITVRAALGGSRWRLIRQLLTESLVISIAGGIAGIVLARVSVPALLALAPAGKIPRTDSVALDGWVLAFTLGLSILTGMLFGLGPAIQATGRELRQSLSDASRTLTGRKEGLRGALVVLEIALALVLLTGAGLLLKSFWRLQSVDPGFRAANVLTATIDLPESRYRTPAQMRTFHESTLATISALRGVEIAAAVNAIPLGTWFISGDFLLESGGRSHLNVYKPVISPGYFRAMGIRLLSGRDFSAFDNQSAPGVAIVSQSVARKLWPAANPLGKRISMEDHPKPEDWLTVVGVVDDIRQKELASKPAPAVYLPYMQVNRPFLLNEMTFVLHTTADPIALAAAVRAGIQGVDPDQAVESIATMTNVIDGTTAEPRFRARVLGVFSILALVLSAIGIYGVLACSIAERTHEIGIRVAIGASRGSIALMVFRRTLLLAAAGIGIGAAGALAVTRVLKGFLFEVNSTDPGTFAAVASVLVAVAFLAGWLPARRASTVDPLIALRYE